MGTGVSHKRIDTENFRVTSCACKQKKRRRWKFAFISRCLLLRISDSVATEKALLSRCSLNEVTCHQFLDDWTVKQPLLFSLERRWSSRTFRYGYLVTTSPQLPVLPSAAPPLKVRPLTSGITGSHGVTGGVYKTRERIHRDILIRDY